MIETVRARLTIWYVAALAAALIMVGGLIYVLLARALYVRIDENLAAVSRIAMTSLANDLDRRAGRRRRRTKHRRGARLQSADAADLRRHRRAAGRAGSRR